MLKEILCISGKPGLYKLLSYGKNSIIVENLIDKKRMPGSTRDKIISLGDIAIYTDEEDVPLGKVLTTIYEKNKGEQIDVKALNTKEELFDYFSTILPSFDQERVYPTDIKKLLNWYNILVNAGFTSFEKVEEPEEAESDPKAEK